MFNIKKFVIIFTFIYSISSLLLIFAYANPLKRRVILKKIVKESIVAINETSATCEEFIDTIIEEEKIKEAIESLNNESKNNIVLEENATFNKETIGENEETKVLGQYFKKFDNQNEIISEESTHFNNEILGDKNHELETFYEIDLKYSENLDANQESSVEMKNIEESTTLVNETAPYENNPNKRHYGQDALCLFGAAAAIIGVKLFPILLLLGLG